MSPYTRKMLDMLRCLKRSNGSAGRTGRTAHSASKRRIDSLLEDDADERLTKNGQRWVQNPFPYQAKCLAWLRREFAGLTPPDRRSVMQILEPAGCAMLVAGA